MASTTAEVQLYFQCDDPKFVETVNRLRFDGVIERTTREIIDLINPIWDAAYDKGWNRD
jgi:hypothetical protein